MKWLFPNVFSRLFRPARRPVVRRGSSRARFRPNFEQLEDRRLLSFQMLFEQAGFAPKLITDNDVASGDTDPQVGVITFVGTYGTFNLFGDAGLSKPITGSPGMAEMNLTFNVVANPGGTLSISLSDTDFVDPPLAANPLTLTSSLGGTTGGTASTTVQAFADPTNAPFGTGVAAPVQGPFVAPSFADAATVSFNRGPSGYSLTSKTTFTLTPGALITGSHRLQVHGSPTPQPAALGDFVWEDLNANGIQDAGEPGIANVTVKLLDAGGNVVDTTTTDSNGKYLFSDLTPGTYSVMFVAPAGYMVSPANQGADDAKDSDANPANGMTQTVTLAPGETNLTLDAGLFRKAALGDFVWEDLNANGIQDAGEPGIANVTVKLLDAGGNVVDTTTTDSNGKYLFSNLTPGTYSVMFVAPAGYMVSTPNQGADDAKDSDANVINGMTGNYTLASGETNLTVDAGLFRKAALGDFVWMDKDADGIQDVGEPGVANVAVKLMDPAGNVLATTTTDSNGKYLFSNLTPGTYKVMFVLPTGFTFSPANQGGDDAKDSDANVTNGMTGNYTLASGETNLTVDAGLVEQKNEGCPPDYWKKCENYDKWKCYDRWDKFDCVFGVNATGCYTLLESLCLSGTSEKALMREATAALLNAASSTIDYLYTVNQVISMVRQAYATCDFDRIKDLFAAQNTMGCGCHNQPPTGDPATASLTGYVYVDKDNDGRKDSGEAGIANVFIKLYGTDVNGKQVYLTTTTNSQGYYKFDGLKAGTYKIVECQPRNYRDGKDTAGNGGGTALNDQIVDIVLSMGEDSAGYNFGERYGYC